MNSKLSKLFFLMFFLTSVNFLYSQTSFEGEIKFKVSHDENGMTMDYFIKDGKLRMEMGGEAKGTCFIHSNGKSLILMPEQKMYMDLDNSVFKKMQEMMKKNVDKAKEENSDKDFNIENYKTGETKSILGYKCEQWVFNDKEGGTDSKVEAWITDQLGNFMMMESPMGQGFSPGWSNTFKNKGMFPLLVITKDTDGKETSRFEATEIDKKSLSNDLFEVPSGYSEMKIPGM
jgi:hypothetical protein